jgi:thiosulfate reductase cytochrome b subunit
MGEKEQPIVYRHRLPVRLWHWTNALAVFVMLMSGLMIFNAHPRLYWGSYGANYDRAWLEIGASGERGFLRIGDFAVETTGVLGLWKQDGVTRSRAFPSWATIPSYYSLAMGRRWHLAFAWILVAGGLLFWAWSLLSRHAQRNLAPSRTELAPRHLWADIKAHARLRFPAGAAALRYNTLQKLSYTAVLFALLPLMVLSGLAMAPGVDAAWPWLVDVLGGRQSARSIHFIAAMLIALFILVHLVMVALAGPINELRAMITGRYRLPKERGA